MNEYLSDPDVVIAALRLAVESAADAETMTSLIGELLDRAAPSDPRSTESVRLLLDAIKATDVEIAVS